jgi:hypothetical protein
MKAHPDKQSPHCAALVKYGAWFFSGHGVVQQTDGTSRPKSDPVLFQLPLSPAKRARNDAAKAVRRSYTVESLGKTNGLITDVRDILTSRSVRQGRQINWVQNRYDGALWDLRALPWPIYDYRAFDCPQHNLRLHVVRQSGHVLGYCETCRVGDFAVVTQFMTHADSQKDGISNMLMLEAGFARTLDGCTHFSYGCESHRDSPMWSFITGLGAPIIGGKFEDI